MAQVAPISHSRALPGKRPQLSLGSQAGRTATSYIEPGSPWQNPYVESFNSRARDELFAREVFNTLMEARVLFEDWCHVYNHQRPHSALA